MERSTLDDTLIQAYRETEYRVFAARPFVLRIDLESPQLAAIHRQFQCRCSAFLSACNPFSTLTAIAQNAALHAALARELAHLGLARLEGIGQHPRNDWPGEPSWLALGIAREEAMRLGHGWRQNAIVWIAEDAIPRLVLLR